MIEHINQRAVELSEETPVRLVLSFEQRARSRFRAELEDGRPVAIHLERGRQLLPGERLIADSGLQVEVVAALEKVSEVRVSDVNKFARACYHLGNRHVALQIGNGFLRYLHDHVLDQMVESLGLEIVVIDSTFEPEPGAYGAYARVSGHSH